jgi:hypothetical protein
MPQRGSTTPGALPYRSSALALAAISAGPGSKLQQQLFTLLCSMVKVSAAPIVAGTAQCTADRSAPVWYQSLHLRQALSGAAAITAAALVSGAGDIQQPCPCDLGLVSHAAAVSQLPALFIGPLLHVLG